MGQVEKYYGIEVGETVFPLIGAYKNLPVKVVNIKINEGARNGWFTCQYVSKNGIKTQLLYAGEEIAKTPPSGILSALK